jgi:hypothetical protein
MLIIKGDYSEMERELDRLDHVPNFKDKKLLDGVLLSGYTETQIDVHVRTGSLKSSGKQDSETHGKVWKGTISYGGPSAGVNNPVKYAIYEKARGGAHDFMKNLHLTHSEFIEAIKEALKG